MNTPTPEAEAGSVKLEACPFCGPDGEPSLWENRDHKPKPLHGAICDKCGAEITGGYSKAEAITAWNTRIPQPSAAGLENEIVRIILASNPPKGRAFRVPNAHAKADEILRLLHRPAPSPSGLDAEMIERVRVWITKLDTAAERQRRVSRESLPLSDQAVSYAKAGNENAKLAADLRSLIALATSGEK